MRIFSDLNDECPHITAVELHECYVIIQPGVFVLDDRRSWSPYLRWSAWTLSRGRELRVRIGWLTTRKHCHGEKWMCHCDCHCENTFMQNEWISRGCHSIPVLKFQNHIIHTCFEILSVYNSQHRRSSLVYCTVRVYVLHFNKICWYHA